MTKVRELIPRVQRSLSQLGGIGVQPYAEDAIIEKLQTSFNMMFSKYFWDEYTHWQETALDGTFGVPVVSTDVWAYPLVKFVDIAGVYREDNLRQALPTCPGSVNPHIVQGNTPKFIRPFDVDPVKVFKVVPATATGTVWVHYRSRPRVFDLETDILLDEEMMKLAATYQYLADDGTNPEATNTIYGLLTARERIVIGNTSNQPISTNPRSRMFSTSEWYG